MEPGRAVNFSGGHAVGALVNLQRINKQTSKCLDIFISRGYEKLELLFFLIKKYLGKGQSELVLGPPEGDGLRGRVGAGHLHKDSGVRQDLVD